MVFHVIYIFDHVFGIWSRNNVAVLVFGVMLPMDIKQFVNLVFPRIDHMMQILALWRLIYDPLVYIDFVTVLVFGVLLHMDIKQFVNLMFTRVDHMMQILALWRLMTDLFVYIDFVIWGRGANFRFPATLQSAILRLFHACVLVPEAVSVSFYDTILSCRWVAISICAVLNLKNISHIIFNINEINNYHSTYIFYDFLLISVRNTRIQSLFSHWRLAK